MRLGPRINDISTDLDDPPAFPSGKPGPFPDTLKRIVARHYPEVKTLRLPGDRAAAFDRVRRVAEQQPGWRLSHIDPDGGLIQGVAVTRLLRFRDDFVIRVREHDGAAIVDMRSKSRLGKADFGANATRIQRFFADLGAAG